MEIRATSADMGVSITVTALFAEKHRVDSVARPLSMRHCACFCVQKASRDLMFMDTYFGYHKGICTIVK